MQNNLLRFEGWCPDCEIMITELEQIVIFPADGDGTIVAGHDLPNKDWHDIFLRQFTGCYDKKKNEIFGDDLLKDDKGIIFRIYQVPGGFVMKESNWRKNCNDLISGDELIFASLSNIQLKNWIQENCEKVGNIYQNYELIK